MPIISATALKGGCGKTTLVHHAAGAFALSGRRVLAVDNDAQASLSSGMFGAAAVEQLDPSSTIAAIYAGEDPLPEQIIRPSGIAGVDVIAGSMAAARFNHPEPYAAAIEAQTCLRSFLAEVRDQYDVILIDNPPNLQAANWAALVASDFLIVPLTPEDYSSMSLSPVLECIRLAASGPNPNVAMLGLVLTMVQPRLGVHVAYESVLRQVHGEGVFATRIPMAADIKEAISQRKAVTHYKPRGASSKVFKALVEEIVSRIEGQGRAAALGMEAA
jgi:chromosome partitioning protein